MTANTRMLDLLFPLRGASHADAVSYAIVIPMRYAECVATLRDGREVRFREPRKLLGWSGPAERRRFLLYDGYRGIEIRTNASKRRQIRRIRERPDMAVLGPDDRASQIHKFIGRDGDLLYVRLQLPEGVSNAEAATDRKTRHGMEPGPALEGCLS